MSKKRPSALQAAIAAVGSKSELARRLKINRQAVQQWERNGVPIGQCKAIEAATSGIVTRAQLRPDAFA